MAKKSKGDEPSSASAQKASTAPASSPAARDTKPSKAESKPTEKSAKTAPSTTEKPSKAAKHAAKEEHTPAIKADKKSDKKAAVMADESEEESAASDEDDDEGSDSGSDSDDDDDDEDSALPVSKGEIRRSGRRPVVFLDLQAGPVSLGRLVIRLHTDVPLACENFRALCTGEYTHPETGKPLSYLNTELNMVREDYVVGGDVDDINGNGQMSIYGAPFEDEEAGLKREHTIGTVSMFSTKKNSNDSKFVICLRRHANFMDGQYVVVGEVIKGLKAAFSATQFVKDFDDGTPEVPIYVSACGRIKKDKKEKKEKKDKADDKKDATEPAAAASAAAASTDASSGQKPPCPKCGHATAYVRRVAGRGIRLRCKSRECDESFWAPDAHADAATARAAEAEKERVARKAALDAKAARAAEKKAERRAQHEAWVAAKEANKAKAAAEGLTLEEYVAKRREERKARDAEHAAKLAARGALPVAEEKDSDAEDEEKVARAAAKVAKAAAAADRARARVRADMEAKGRAHLIAGPQIKSIALAAGAAATTAQAARAAKDSVKSDRRVAKKREKRVADKLQKRRDEKAMLRKAGFVPPADESDDEGNSKPKRFDAPHHRSSGPRPEGGARPDRPRFEGNRHEGREGRDHREGRDNREGRGQYAPRDGETPRNWVPAPGSEHGHVGRSAEGKKLRHRDIGTEGVAKLQEEKAKASKAFVEGMKEKREAVQAKEAAREAERRDRPHNVHNAASAGKKSESGAPAAKGKDEGDRKRASASGHADSAPKRARVGALIMPAAAPVDAALASKISDSADAMRKLQAMRRK